MFNKSLICSIIQTTTFKSNAPFMVILPTVCIEHGGANSQGLALTAHLHHMHAR